MNLNFFFGKFYRYRDGLLYFIKSPFCTILVAVDVTLSKYSWLLHGHEVKVYVHTDLEPTLMKFTPVDRGTGGRMANC